ALCSFLFNVPASTELSTLSLHDALPILSHWPSTRSSGSRSFSTVRMFLASCRMNCLRTGRLLMVISAKGLTMSFMNKERWREPRSEEHTSELQSRENLVCRLLLEKKKKD